MISNFINLSFDRNETIKREVRRNTDKGRLYVIRD